MNYLTLLSTALKWTSHALVIAGSHYERDVALGFFDTGQRRTARAGDREACTHESGHAHGADRGRFDVDEADAQPNGSSLARIVVHPPAGRPHPACTDEEREDWYAFVRMRVEGPIAQARFCVEARRETATVERIWHELGVVAGCEEDLLDAREITRALSSDEWKARELLHALAHEVVLLIATDAATWRTIQIGAQLLRERRGLHGRDFHWLMHRARKRESFDEIRAGLRRRIARRNRRLRRARAMPPPLLWFTQGVATAR